MKKLIIAVAASALLASSASAVLAGGGHRHHGFGYGHSYYAGHNYNYRPYGSHRHRHGGHYYLHGDGTVDLGIFAGAVILGSLLLQPPPARPKVLRSPTGAPLGGCTATTGTWYSHPARFSDTMCYDPAGRAYVLPGSERFVGYLR